MAVAEGIRDEWGREFEDKFADCSVTCADEVDSEVAEAVYHGLGWRCWPARVLDKSQGLMGHLPALGPSLGDALDLGVTVFEEGLEFFVRMRPRRGPAVVLLDVRGRVPLASSRCIVTTIDPDTGEQDVAVFRRIRREFDGSLALNCWVIEGGSVRVGDPVDVVPLPHEIAAEAMARPGGWVTGMPYPGAPSLA